MVRVKLLANLSIILVNDEERYSLAFARMVKSCETRGDK